MLIVLLALLPATARAQGAGLVLNLETSARALGMGGAGAGVAWGDPAAWANVASISRVEGMRFEHARELLLPGLSSDIVLRASRVDIGRKGIAGSLLGAPGMWDGTRLDYGNSTQTDASGNVVGAFSSYESVRGVSMAAEASAIAGLMDPAHSPTWLGRGADLSLGFAWKRTRIAFAPSTGATASLWDWGAQARLAPLELFAATERPRQGLAGFAVLDIGLGYGVRNALGGPFHFSGPSGSAGATRAHCAGVALRLGVHMPALAPSGTLATLSECFDPLVAVTAAGDHTTSGVAGGSTTYPEKQSGVEIAVANVFFLRRGRWIDDVDDYDRELTGWGAGLPIGPWGGVRYESSTIPEPMDSGLPDRKLTSWSLWVDPLRISRDLGRRRPRMRRPARRQARLPAA
jgi:hypothetical protein